MTHNLLFIGCGNMGRAILFGFLAKRETLGIESVQVCKPTEPERPLPGVDYVTQLKETAVPSTIILAIKPAQLGEVARETHDVWGDEPLYISIAAGKMLASLQASLGDSARVIRAMPNTPVVVSQGMTSLAAGAVVTEADRQVAEQLFAGIGRTAWIDESLMDAATALAGSGPAYVYYLAECLVKAGQSLGLDADTASIMARQTLLGAATLAGQPGSNLVDLREAVTSKGGTTEAALEVLMQDDALANLLQQAMSAAVARAKAMG